MAREDTRGAAPPQRAGPPLRRGRHVESLASPGARRGRSGGVPLRIGIDTGGTFTDVVVAGDRGVVSFKVPSTPADPSIAILGALAAAGWREGSAAPAAGIEVVHGSTVATNALLEGKTARVALVTTAGFEDVLEIGRQSRPSLYDLEATRPPPLVSRDLRFGIPERVLADGSIRRPLDAGAVRRAAEAAVRAGADAVAVCFLHSYIRPGHEAEAARLLREIFHGPVTISSSLVREFREYERCSTAAVNAAVSPLVGKYLRRLEGGLEAGSLTIMGSNGGALAPGVASDEAVRTVLSGPAAGVVAARRACAAVGIGRLVSFDMGGTSTDVSLVPDQILLSGETVVAGYPIRTPVVDIHTVGAGGGSIAWIDPGGALKVGPRSAGADPGPACYGHGGPATVTDANLFLGRIVPERFLDGKMALDAAAAERAIGALAASLGMSLEETASGILDVANVTMARAIRHVSLFRGFDPAGFALCAFGGAGGLHASSVAAAAGIDEVLVPAEPGVLSAWGLLAGDLVADRSETVLVPAGPVSDSALRSSFARLASEASSILLGTERPASAGDRVVVERTIDARYRGQSHEIAVPADGDWIAAFHAEHFRRYGFDRRGDDVIAVTVRVAARLPVAPVPFAAPERREAGRRPARLWDRGEWREGVSIERGGLTPGETVRGPAVVTEAGATTFVPSGSSAIAGADGSLRIRRAR
ncbi:MAG: hydantoinase/oxoprolinase family protein [Acidobacteria bacterium]|nr:hydantoinase/oxoprolinase family protein [Acidobacteriota bacterium]